MINNWDIKHKPNLSYKLCSPVDSVGQPRCRVHGCLLSSRHSKGRQFFYRALHKHQTMRRPTVWPLSCPRSERRLSQKKFDRFPGPRTCLRRIYFANETADLVSWTQVTFAPKHDHASRPTNQRQEQQAYSIEFPCLWKLLALSVRSS